MAGGASLIARPVGPASLIADASPLVALSLIDRLHWLPDIFGPVHVVGAVLNEVLTGQFDASESSIRTALDKGWLTPIEPDPGSPARITLQQRPDWKLLDPGEADSIAYAMAQTHRWRCSQPIISQVLAVVRAKLMLYMRASWLCQIA